MNHYYAKVSARIQCAYCTEKILVTNHEEIDASEDHLTDFGGQVTDVIGDQMEADGWVNGYCPDCIELHPAEIRAIESADDDKEDDA